MALPTNVGFGTVTGAFLRAVADSPVDADRDPEGLPVTDLIVRFTAELAVPVVRDMSAVPPVTIMISTIEASVGADGILLGPDGQPGVRLVASTDPDLVPSNWTWKASFLSATFPAISFSFTLDSGASVDLATVVQVPASPGATLDAWLAAVATTTAARDSAIAARDAAVAAAAGVPSRTELAATYVALRGPWAAGTAYPKNSLVVQAGAVYLAAADVPARSVFTAADWQALGGAAAAAVATVVNGDGFLTLSGAGVVDNGDGFLTLTDSSVTDNGDGFVALAA